MGLTDEQFTVAYLQDLKYTKTFLSRVGCPPHLCDEFAQEAWAKAWEHRAQFKGNSLIRTWVQRIAFNVYLSERRRKSWKNQELTAEIVATLADDNTESGTKEMSASELRRAIDSIPAHYSVVMIMALEGKSREDIAKTLGISTPAVKSRLWRARDMAIRIVQGVPA